MFQIAETMCCVLQYDPDLLNSFDSNPKRHLNYAARYSRSESLVDEEDAMLSYEAQPWNSDLEGKQLCCVCLNSANHGGS